MPPSFDCWENAGLYLSKGDSKGQRNARDVRPIAAHQPLGQLHGRLHRRDGRGQGDGASAIKKTDEKKIRPIAYNYAA